ncbi:hypothetical protein CC2G_003298 [Coprinopsis cinerea AmutBmut pab1-1]|nr:hypothetical protein CC2G_003298 [Coprinopsis cinerea AmutBmut pab1-1]
MFENAVILPSTNSIRTTSYEVLDVQAPWNVEMKSISCKTRGRRLGYWYWEFVPVGHENIINSTPVLQVIVTSPNLSRVSSPSRGHDDTNVIHSTGLGTAAMVHRDTLHSMGHPPPFKFTSKLEKMTERV